MDNENKMIELSEQRHNEVLMFLRDELEPLKRRDVSETYNLETEYGKTKHNKSPFVSLLLLACLAIVSMVAFGLSKSIEKTNKDIEVNLAEFDDVNLKNLIDTVARTQDQYEAAVRNKSQLEADKNSELLEAASKRDNDLIVIKSMKFTNKKEENRRIEAANESYESQVKEINEKYESQIAAATSEVEEYKKKLDEYDQSKLAVAREQEKALDSQRQLQDLEKKQLASKYKSRIANLEAALQEVRKTNSKDMESSLLAVSNKFQAEIDTLDPIIFNPKAEEIADSAMNDVDLEYLFKNHDIYSEGVVEDEDLLYELEYVKSRYEDYKYINKFIAEVPYKHSLGKYVNAADKIIDDISLSFADLTSSLYEGYADLEDEISDLESKVDDLKREKKQLEEAHKKQIAKLEESHKSEIESLNESHEAELESAIIATKEETDDFLAGILEFHNTGAVVKSAETRDDIILFVAASFRDDIPEDGINGEIKLKKTIKGKVLPARNGDFVFVPNKDKNGNDIPFDIEDVKIGMTVKLQAK